MYTNVEFTPYTKVLKEGQPSGDPSVKIRLIATITRNQKDTFTVQLQFKGDPTWYDNAPTPTTNGELAKEVYSKVMEGE